MEQEEESKGLIFDIDPRGEIVVFYCLLKTRQVWRQPRQVLWDVEVVIVLLKGKCLKNFPASAWPQGRFFSSTGTWTKIRISVLKPAAFRSSVWHSPSWATAAAPEKIWTSKICIVGPFYHETVLSSHYFIHQINKCLGRMKSITFPPNLKVSQLHF